jgi:AcrR family transcriptional regulator
MHTQSDKTSTVKNGAATKLKQTGNAGSKGARAQEALLDAGLELLGEMSPRELTAGTICIAAQMKRPSFYTYFDSVDDLLDAMIRREIDRLEALYDAQEAKNKTALHRLARIPLNLVDIARRDIARLTSVVTLMTYDPSFTHSRMGNLRRDVEASIAEGAGRKKTAIARRCEKRIANIIAGRRGGCSRFGANSEKLMEIAVKGACL